MDTSAYTFHITSTNFTGHQPASSSSSSSSTPPPVLPPPPSPSPLVSQYQLQLAEHIQSFTTTFLTSQPTPLSPTTRSSILSLSTSTHPPPPPLPPPPPPPFTTLTLTPTPTPPTNIPPRRRVRAYIDGCYDCLHAGHYNAIRQARTLCDELVLGIHSDAEILHHKGPTVMNEEERVAAVKACKWIDQVVFGVPYDPSVELLDALGCDFCVHGDDTSTTATGEDAFAKVKKVGRMRIVKRTEGISTTDLVRRLLTIGKARAAQGGEGGGGLKAVTGGGAAPLSVPAPASQLPLSHPRVSSFLPVSFRLAQFTNNRTPLPTDRVVYVAGDFDLFHVGHIDMLQAAKARGTFLYVGVYDDEECGRLMGEGFPVMSMFERVMNVLACKWVDEVVMGVKRRVSADMRTSLNIAAVIDSEESERRRVERKRKGAKEGKGEGG